MYNELVLDRWKWIVGRVDWWGGKWMDAYTPD